MSHIPEAIKKLIQKNDPKIKHLDLSNLGLNDDDISELQELLQQNKNIISLNLANNNITANGCKEVGLIFSLRKVDLSHCSIGDKGVAEIIKTKIEDLDVSYCNITEKGAQLLLAKLHQYNALNISGNAGIAGGTLEKIRTKFVKKASVENSPVGIDLGLNIWSSFEQYLNFSNPILSTDKKLAATSSKNGSPTSHEQKLVDKVLENYADDLAKSLPMKKNDL